MNLSVTKIWKLLKIWQSYHHVFGVLPFQNTVHINRRYKQESKPILKWQHQSISIPNISSPKPTIPTPLKIWMVQSERKSHLCTFSTICIW